MKRQHNHNKFKSAAKNESPASWYRCCSVRWHWLAVVLWIGLIFWFSHQPGEVSSALSGKVLAFLEQVFSFIMPAGFFQTSLLRLLIRKAAHVLNYTVLGILLARASLRSIGKVLPATLIFGFLAAVADEIHQCFVPGRSGEVRDVAIDLAGVALGAGLTWLLRRRALRISLSAE